MLLETDTLQNTVHAIIHEKLKNLCPTILQPQVASLTDIIWEVEGPLGTSATLKPLWEPQATAYVAALYCP